MNKKILSLLLCFAPALDAGAAGVEVRDTLGLKSAAATNVSEMLRGSVAGVRVSSIDGNPEGLMNVNIRGVNSLRSDNQPLWIIDGAMISTDLNDNLAAFWQYGELSYTSPLNPLSFLNAADIESIEVLKDASATALYGSRGAGGVVLITTKMESGSRDEVSFSSDFGLNASATPGILAGTYTPSQNHRIAVSGTVNRTGYNFSATLRRSNGILPGNGSTNGTLKVNINSRANRTVWFGFNTYLSLGQSSSPTGVSYVGKPSMTLALRDASLFGPTTVEQWTSDYDDDSDRFRGVASTYLRLNLLRNLHINVSAGMDIQRDNRVIWYGKGTEMGAVSATNQYGGAASTVNSLLASYNAKAEVSWHRTFGMWHDVKAEGVVDAYGNYMDFNTMNGFNFVSHDLRGRGLMLGAYEILNHATARSYFHYGTYALLSYDYRKTAGIEAVARLDDTPKYLGTKRAFHPSVSAYFDAKKALAGGAEWLSALKLSAGYGISGIERQVPYDLIGNYLTSAWPEPVDDSDPFYDGVSTLRTSEWHVTLDAGLKCGVDFEATYFDRSTDDVFDMVCLGQPSEDEHYTDWTWGGCETVLSRRTVIANRGVEFGVSAKSGAGSLLRWSVDANVAYVDNVITYSDKADFHGKKVGGDFYCTCNGANVPVSTLYGYKVDSYGNLMDRNLDGRLDDADMVVLGTTVPKVYGGLDLTLGAGRFNLLLSLDGSAGHKVANMNYLEAKGLKGPDGAYVLTDVFVEDASFLRLGTVGITYIIPFRKSLRSIDLRLQCHNAAILTGYSGWNPDVNCFGVSAVSSGIDYGSYPLMRSLIAGVSVKF